MNKTQSVTAGAIIAVGLMMRPSGPMVPPATGHKGPPAQAGQFGGTGGSEEGPWEASCKYWQPARGLDPDGKARTAKLSISIKESDTEFTSSVVGKPEDDSPCSAKDSSGAARWGIPQIGGEFHPEIRTIIAAVPDPVHTHLALAFDREIDALVMAAGDNGYVPSYFWLPWGTHPQSLSPEGSTANEQLEADPRRNRQPGLIVFKHVPEDEREDGYPWSSYDKVIYVFLVAEAPALGMDGAQLANAFKYEGDLRSIPGADVSFSTKSASTLSIIGPDASGSAASLREAIETAHPVLEQSGFAPSHASPQSPATRPGAKLDIEIAGATSTSLADDLLFYWRSQDGHKLRAIGDVNYISFGENSDFENKQLLTTLSCSGYHLDRVAILWEDSTVYGASGTTQADTPFKSDRSKDEKGNCAVLVGAYTGKPVVIRFPREISLLRNAHLDTDGSSEPAAKAAPSPFLHLSLKDPGVDDGLPQFSPEHMPLSQEAQLMAIGRRLRQIRAQFILVNASNELDEIFLARFLHRACPDARLVFFGGDLLLERETENAPYIGAITLGPYNLLGPTDSGSEMKRTFADSQTEAYFNAASYTFWDGNAHDGTFPRLANYRNPLQPGSSRHASLWATAVGSDGYYPLGIVDDCASDLPRILPAIDPLHPSLRTPKLCAPLPPGTRSDVSLGERVKRLFFFSDEHYRDRPYRYPALSWQLLCVLIGLLCLGHTYAVCFPNYWSPFTRDMAIPEGDEPRRRSMYIFIGTTMLFCMAFVIAYPVFPTFRVLHPEWHTIFYSLWALTTAGIALGVTIRKTHPYLKWNNADAEESRHTEAAAVLIRPCEPVLTQSQAATPPGCNVNRTGSTKQRLERLHRWLGANVIFLFNVIALLTLVLLPISWIAICHTEKVHDRHNYVGLFFSYRCLYPGSGVSPLVPILLILAGWYLWSIFQALRLRFAVATRPKLPQFIIRKSSWPLFVPDNAVSHGGPASRGGSLVSNITCLLITREMFCRLFPKAKWWPTLTLIGIYVGGFSLLVFGLGVESFDRMLWQPGNLPTLYEFCSILLAFPLVVIALAGWFRTLMIWESLKRDVLEQLELLPIRQAFSRVKGVGWLNMMRKGGLPEQWRDMARSTESMRQMVHDPELMGSFSAHHNVEKTNLLCAYKELDAQVHAILDSMNKTDADSPKPAAGQKQLQAVGQALLPGGNHAEKQGAENQLQKQKEEDRADGRKRMIRIEECYARFCEALLSGVLLPYWEDIRLGLVEGNDAGELLVKVRSTEKDGGDRAPASLELSTGTSTEEPMHIRVAEEFLVIRYIALIRAVLINVRYLLAFVSTVFVLTIVAWNSYPFQPRQWMDEAFTGLLVLLGSGIIWVFAQMHRNPILSRITDTSTNDLGLDFYLRLITFGAIPVLTWLAYQFPEVGGTLFRLIQPSLGGMK